eukprot:3173950-Prymnesium_polylepis.1
MLWGQGVNRSELGGGSEPVVNRCERHGVHAPDCTDLRLSTHADVLPLGLRSIRRGLRGGLWPMVRRKAVSSATRLCGASST